MGVCAVSALHSLRVSTVAFKLVVKRADDSRIQRRRFGYYFVNESKKCHLSSHVGGFFFICE